jgi:hypothetical protein
MELNVFVLKKCMNYTTDGEAAHARSPYDDNREDPSYVVPARLRSWEIMWDEANDKYILI